MLIENISLILFFSSNDHSMFDQSKINVWWINAFENLIFNGYTKDKFLILLNIYRQTRIFDFIVQNYCLRMTSLLIASRFLIDQTVKPIEIVITSYTWNVNIFIVIDVKSIYFYWFLFKRWQPNVKFQIIQILS